MKIQKQFIAGIATGSASKAGVDMANNALDNATGTVFVDYVRKARPKMRESSVLQGDHWRIGHSNGIADPFRMV